MTDVRPVSDTPWEWRVGNKGFGVRVSASTRKLIYSNWTDTPDGPIFNGGVAQIFDQILTEDAPPFHVPEKSSSRTQRSPKQNLTQQDT